MTIRRTKSYTTPLGQALLAHLATREEWVFPDDRQAILVLLEHSTSGEAASRRLFIELSALWREKKLTRKRFRNDNSQAVKILGVELKEPPVRFGFCLRGKVDGKRGRRLCPIEERLKLIS
ncbi:hypothetical protein NVP2117O_19 [Vibrio phage 2.117.O._10N.261.45.E9]|nr:hypothetical protein NVP1117O_19 [Vibrio phage 1.117.O._10N.261.45.E9]AUR95420.1 hypothetical protein NVP1207B_13 [Vibrio phage 1.207.B._10N.222.51.C2]AUS02311.1 hypothetical protein NVP2117O_19 [Vibrio phage 2.117.O._10N.261.45.E9]